MRPTLTLPGILWIGLLGACSFVEEYVHIVDFVVDEGTNLAFDVSPDGESIVFDLLGQLWLMPSAGGTAERLTDAVRDTAEDLDPAFSPDGGWIVFQGDRPEGVGLWLIPATGGEPTNLWLSPDGTFGKQFTHFYPSWSPDSREVLFAFRDTVMRIDVRTGALTTSVIEPADSGATLIGINAPTPAPDGALLVVGTGASQAFRTGIAASASLWEAGPHGGGARQITASGSRAVSPEYSPDGTSVAYFTRDANLVWHLSVQPRDGEARRLVASERMAVRRVRWTPDGRSLIYSANGRLWRVSAEGGDPREIPFSARIQFERKVVKPGSVAFAGSGDREPARGFYGLALSPDGERIAMLALGRLWIWPVGGTPTALTEVPDGSYHLSWSPDGNEIAFTDGDVHAANLRTGQLRRLTALTGHEGFPAWSPDGARIAFIHWGSETPEAGWDHLRVAPARASPAEELSHTLDLGPMPWAQWGRNEPVWSADSRRLLVYGTDETDVTANKWVSIEGSVGELGNFPSMPTFLSRSGPDSVIYVHGLRLWKAGIDQERGVVGDARPISDEPALYPTMSSDGSVLYVSEHGLRLRRPTAETLELGWPLDYVTPNAVGPLLIRNARIVDGTGAQPVPAQDLLIKGGRISKIGPTGSIQSVDGALELDAEGRTVVPGLVDAHQHVWTPHPPLEGQLYNGVTTVRDVGSSLAWSGAHRDLIASGQRPGPRIVLGGSFFLSGGGLSKDAGFFVEDRQQIARGIALVRSFGAQYVKHYYGGWATLTQIIDEAHRHGMRVSAHCGSILPAIAAGMDGQEHSGACLRGNSFIYADYARIKSEAGMWLVSDPGFYRSHLEVRDDPDLINTEAIRSFLHDYAQERFDVGGSLARWVDFFERQTAWRDERLRVHRQAHVPFAVGTDLWFPTAINAEMEGLAAVGLTPMEIIVAATSVPAGVLGASAEIGTIEVGKLADLVILDADPLEDIEHMRQLWQVIQGGRVVDRDALLRFAGASTAIAAGPEYGY